MTPELEAGFRECQRIASRAAPDFAWSFWFLPLDQRRAVQSLYAFARLSDDIADSPEPLDVRRARLAEWRDQLRKALDGHPAHPVLAALADTVSRFVVPQHLLWRILDGVETDLDHHGFARYADLRRYCEQVASAVGLACLSIWGSRQDDAILPAADCGVAFQLTQILRDLQSDGRVGRIYLPRDELARFGCAPVDWLGPLGTENLSKLIVFQCQRAAGLFEAGARTERFLDHVPKRVFRLNWTMHRALLAQIERDPLLVVRKCARLSWPRKAVLAARLLFVK